MIICMILLPSGIINDDDDKPSLVRIDARNFELSW